MWVLTAGQYAAAITAILALFGIVVKWGIVKPIKNYIDIATLQINPNTNGGTSLSDVALGVARVERKIENLSKRVETLENTLKAPQNL
jgi:hypothetical protein